jgi:hypothetical protein
LDLSGWRQRSEPAAAAPRRESGNRLAPASAPSPTRISPPYFERFPEQITQYGVPGRSHSPVTDNSLAAYRACDAREDAFLADLKPIDPATIGGGPLRATSAIARQPWKGTSSGASAATSCGM